MKIRRAALDDSTQLRDLARALRWERHLVLIQTALPDGHILIAHNENHIIGMLVWNRAFFSRPFIWLLGILPAEQRRGVASRLISEVERACPGESLFISTNKSNDNMQALCTKMGFVESGYLEHLDEGDPEIFFFKQL